MNTPSAIAAVSFYYKTRSVKHWCHCIVTLDPDSHQAIESIMQLLCFVLSITVLVHLPVLTLFQLHSARSPGLMPTPRIPTQPRLIYVLLFILTSCRQNIYSFSKKKKHPPFINLKTAHPKHPSPQARLASEDTRFLLLYAHAEQSCRGVPLVFAMVRWNERQVQHIAQTGSSEQEGELFKKGVHNTGMRHRNLRTSA